MRGVKVLNNRDAGEKSFGSPPDITLLRAAKPPAEAASATISKGASEPVELGFEAGTFPPAHIGTSNSLPSDKQEHY